MPWTTYGPVRGDCGHRHRTQQAAQDCANLDQRVCKLVGGYSDREVYDERRALRNAAGDVYAVRSAEALRAELARERARSAGVCIICRTAPARAGLATCQACSDRSYASVQQRRGAESR